MGGDVFIEWSFTVCWGGIDGGFGYLVIFFSSVRFFAGYFLRFGVLDSGFGVSRLGKGCFFIGRGGFGFRYFNIYFFSFER